MRFGLALERRPWFGLGDEEPIPLDALQVTACDVPGDTLWAVAHRPDTARFTGSDWSDVYGLMPLSLSELDYGAELGPNYAVLRPPAALRPGRCYVVSVRARYYSGGATFEVDGDGRGRARDRE